MYECGSIARYGVDETKVYAGEEGFEMRVRPKSRLVNEKPKKAKWDKKEINQRKKKRALRDTWRRFM